MYYSFRSRRQRPTHVSVQLGHVGLLWSCWSVDYLLHSCRSRLSFTQGGPEGPLNFQKFRQNYVING